LTDFDYIMYPQSAHFLHDLVPLTCRHVASTKKNVSNDLVRDQDEIEAMSNVGISNFSNRPGTRSKVGQKGMKATILNPVFFIQSYEWNIDRTSLKRYPGLPRQIGKGSFTYYVTQNSDFLDPLSPIVTNFVRKKISLV